MYTRIQNIQKIKVCFSLGAPSGISHSTSNAPPAPDALGRNPNTLTFDRSNDILYIDAIYRTLRIAPNEARIQDARQLILQYFDTLLQNRNFPHKNKLQNFITYLNDPTTTNGLDLIKRILYTENNLSQLHITFPDNITQAIRNMEDPRVEEMRQAFIQMNVAHEQYTTIHYPLY